MKLVLFLVLFLSVVYGQTLSLEFDSSNGYSINVNGQSWLKSGPFALHFNNNWYSTKDNTLKLASNSSSTGNDPLGAYKSTTFSWTAGQYQWQTSFKVYGANSFIVFTQTFSGALSGTSTGSDTEVLSAFPTFLKEQTPALHYLTYYGIFAEAKTGTWGTNTNYQSGIQGGPLALFNNNLLTLVISPLDHYMSSIQTLSSYLSGNFACGIQGKITSVPAGYTHSTIISLSQGVNKAFTQWGSLLLKYHGKQPISVGNDNSIKFLGYWTDNGAYYYYNTESGKNYADSMVDVYNYIESIKLPVQYYQFDSWWYFKGNTQGLVLWEPRPDIFPNGMKPLMDKMGSKAVVLHNRWFENDTDYYTQMKYPFIAEKGYAIPLTVDPYVYFMSKAKEWGMIVYEQDWLIDQFLNMESTLTDISLGENWMNNMNKAAQQVGVTMQLCMPLPSQVLQSVAMSQVTQIRASGDYQRQVYDKDQWEISHTSIFYDSIGVYPFKDCFWSNNETQTGCGATVCQEPNAVVETLVSLLSAGPVAPADKIGFLSLTNLMQTTRADGVLLKPDAPARTMDLVFSLGFKTTPTLYTLSSTRSRHVIQDGLTDPAFMWHYIFAANTNQQLTIAPADLEQTDNGNLFVLDYFQTPTVLSRFSNTSPLVIPTLKPNGDLVDYRYYVVFETSSTSYSLIGERNKFAVASAQRFVSITKAAQSGTTTTKVTFNGAMNEEVTIEMLHTPTRKIESYKCRVTAVTATLTCTETSSTNSCSC